MNASLEIALQSAWVTAAVSLFLQSSVLLVIGLSASRLFSTLGPSVRSAILRATLVAIILCPGASLAFKSLGVGGLALTSHRISPPTNNRVVEVTAAAEPPVTAQASHIQRIASAEPIRASTNEPTLPTRVPRTGNHLIADGTPLPGFRLAQIIAAVWIVISAILTARLLIANLLLMRIRARARPLGAAERQAYGSLARKLGVKPPDIFSTCEVNGPCLVGWLRPAILLPESRCNAEQEVLIHELGHASRRDCAWQLLAQVIRALIWFQPLAWLLPRELERAAEEACDDFVLKCGGDRQAYANRLLLLAEATQSRWMTAGAGASVVGFHSSVGKRISRVLDSKRPLAAPVTRKGYGILLCAAALLTVGAAPLHVGAKSATTQAAQSTPTAKAPAQHAGQVTDADGKPVAGAEIFLVRPVGWQPQVVETTKADAQGNFALTAQPESSTVWLQIEAFAPDRGIGMRAYKPSSPCDIRLQPTTRVSLTLLDAQGKPIAGMKAYPVAFVSKGGVGGLNHSKESSFFFMRMSPAISHRMSGTTDASGTVLFENLPRDTSMELGFDDERFAYPGVSQRIALPENDASHTPLKVKLESAVTISGYVRYAGTARPAPEVEVSAEETNDSYSKFTGGGTVTGPDGAYRLTHLGPGEYNVALFLRGDVRKEWTAAAHERVKVTGGQRITDMNFELIKGGFVRGKVLAADTGKPIPGTDVGVYGPAHPRSSGAVQGALTEPDGSYIARVPPGAQHVYIVGLSREAEVYRPEKQEFQDVTVADGQTVTVDFKLERQKGESVDGIVIGLDGKAAAGITVTAQTGRMRFFGGSTAETDAQGHFHFDSIPAGTRIVVQTNDVGTLKPVPVQKGQGPIRLQLIKRVKLTLKGSIKDKQGKPIPGAQIQVSESHGDYGLSSGNPLISDADGKYEIKDLFSDTQYHIAAVADGFGEIQSQLNLDANTKVLPTLKLPRADATTGGVVVDADGKPLEGITVHMNRGLFPMETVTDAKGRFSFSVPTGKGDLIWLRSTTPGKVGPHVQGYAGRNDLRIVVYEGQ